MQPVTKKTLAALVAEQIRGEIVRGTLKASQKLPSEQELSATLHVGRPTLREALRILEGQGWVQIKFSSGAYVADSENVADRMVAHYGREGLLDLAELELTQLEQEGRQVTEETRRELAGLHDGGTVRQIEEFYQRLQELPVQQARAHCEPNLLADIQEQCDAGAAVKPVLVPEAELEERVSGGLLCRIIGSRIGTPVQGWSEGAIERYLRAVDSYPLTGFVPYSPDEADRGEYALFAEASSSDPVRLRLSEQSNIPEYAVLNDTFLSLKLMTRCGWSFTTDDLGEEWLSSLPYRWMLTAERQAYANLVRGFTPPATATSLNPFREWIGASIRADLYGYVCPGDPRRAASLAYRDARLSHAKNGVYGAMFVAAAIAAAFVEQTAQEVVEAGMRQIPRASRLHELLGSVVGWWSEGVEWREALSRVASACAPYRRPHVLPNLGRLAIGVLYGGLEVRKTVCTTVMCGGDADCNAGAAGSIVGVRAGGSRIPADLREVVKDRYWSVVLGYHDICLADAVKQIAGIAASRPTRQGSEATIRGAGL